jgi:divinyl protochlorophyllide a 8-vinyl-reductase
MPIVEPTAARAPSFEPYDIGARRAQASRIGPNTIIDLAHVLRNRYGEDLAGSLLFDSTGYALTALPGAMVDEREAQTFVRLVMTQLGERTGTRVLHEAGHRTAEYLMTHRIPKATLWVMRALPARAGLSLLLKAVQANAWTFVGSGELSVQSHARGADLTFHACAMCRDLRSDRPVCDFYAGTFEHLVRTLVAPRARVMEVECQAQGGHCCRFEVTGIP